MENPGIGAFASTPRGLQHLRSRFVPGEDGRNWIAARCMTGGPRPTTWSWAAPSRCCSRTPDRRTPGYRGSSEAPGQPWRPRIGRAKDQVSEQLGGISGACLDEW